jgi:CRP-like cAMP-binding protein
MTLQQLRQYFEQTRPISEEAWEAFSKSLIRQEFPKKSIILKHGQTENFISLIEKGTVRFFIPREENDLTFAFIFENELLSAYDSFLTQTPALYAAETITHTILWRFSYDSLQTIYQNFSFSNEIGRRASEEIYLKKAKRELSLLNDTAKERYLKLFIERPEVIKQIPLKYIASYIGITPQALSRIRKEIT